MRAELVDAMSLSLLCIDLNRVTTLFFNHFGDVVQRHIAEIKLEKLVYS